MDALCNRVADDLRQSECARSSVTDRGFDISSLSATVRVFVTTVPPNFRKLEEIHLKAEVMNEAWQAIRHSRWFEENAHNSTIKVLIRILRDIRQRFVGFQPIPTWMLDLLAHYATMNNPTRQALPVNLAFRRSLALISGGLVCGLCIIYSFISTLSNLLQDDKTLNKFFSFLVSTWIFWSKHTRSRHDS